MLPDRVSNPGPLTYESGALPIELRGPTSLIVVKQARRHLSELLTRNCRKRDLRTLAEI